MKHRHANGFSGIAHLSLPFLALILRLREAAGTVLRATNSEHGHARSFVGKVAVGRVAAGESLLRICNAYAYPRGIDVFLAAGRTFERERLTEESGPLPYKSCKDFSGVDLTPGASLSFEISTELFVGAFQVSHLPSSADAMLLIAVYRHDRMTTAADFTSHMFLPGKINGPQIAFVDAYRGTAPAAVLELSNVFYGSAPRRASFGSVLTLRPGAYEFQLAEVFDSNSTRLLPRDSLRLLAVDGRSYVAIRCGVEAFQGPSYREELFLYPAFGEDLLPAIAPRSSAINALVKYQVMAVIAAVVALWS